MCGHNVFEGGFGLFGLKGKAFAALPDMFLHLGSHARPEEAVMHEIKHASRLKWPTSSWLSLRATSLCAAGRTN